MPHKNHDIEFILLRGRQNSLGKNCLSMLHLKMGIQIKQVFNFNNMMVSSVVKINSPNIVSIHARIERHY